MPIAAAVVIMTVVRRRLPKLVLSSIVRNLRSQGRDGVSRPTEAGAADSSPDAGTSERSEQADGDQTEIGEADVGTAERAIGQAEAGGDEVDRRDGTAASPAQPLT